MHGGRARRQTGAHAARGSMSRMRHPTPSLSLFLFLFVVNVHGVWGEDDPDELFNDDPEKSIENDDELECPWDQEGQVGLEGQCLMSLETSIYFENAYMLAFTCRR